jgi:septal ring factor EnvC (AmiA/AmiB activator)
MVFAQDNATTRKIISILVLASFTACAVGPRRTEPLSPAEQNMRREAQFFSESGIVACAVAGGATGVLVAVFDKSKDRYWHAVLAAVAACGVAAGANYYLEAKRVEHADNEGRLNAMITDIRNENARLNSLIASTEVVIAEEKAKFDRIDAEYKRKALSLDQAKTRLASIEDNKQFLEETLAKLKSREAEWQRVAQQERQSAANTAGLDREISQLHERIAQLEGQLEEFDQLRIVEAVG